ncbi:MAG TPA: DUF1993 domain-containing protein [Polyangiaceae bacterium]|jgi:hypothetical protein
MDVVYLVRGLASLKVLLAKGEAHAAAAGIDPAELLGAELAPGMYNLAVQVHWAAEGARMAVDRLTGAAGAPGAADEAKTFDELHRRVDAALAHLGAVPSEAIEAGLARTIEIAHRGASTRYTGTQFLQQFAVPSFFFHLTTAYAILRHKGVPLTKGDFLGPQG